MKNLRNLGLLLLALIAFNATAQTDKGTTKKIVEAKNFIFLATNAIPMNNTEISSILNKMPGSSGGNINLTGGNYDLRITPDSLIGYLPYYGRAYSAPIDRDENGYRFTSTKFTYQNTKRKKGGWEIAMNVNDSKESIRMYLNISENGYASLIVSSNNRQSITFSGYMVAPKQGV
jgi:hypothetical protein